MDRQACIVLLLCAFVRAEEDAYERYVRNAPEFMPVSEVAPRGWDTWIYMPWRHRWAIGTGDEGGRFCREYGINGGFTDRGRAPLKWLEKWGLRFYNDHTAGKGILYLRGANEQARWKQFQNDARAVRPRPLDLATLAQARALVHKHVTALRESPMRLAYALDDEISWGAFLRPLPWRVHGDDAAYAAWLATCYGKQHPAHFVTPDHLFAQFGKRLKELDFSPLLDRLSYNDSVFANFLGDLVRTANDLDGETPCGFVGGQSPNPWGGYDYAKLARKVQFWEVYDQGSAPEIARSLSGAPLVSTHFHKKQALAMDSWAAWSRFAHGQRGMIGWVDEEWFEQKAPRAWLRRFAAVLKELGGVQGPKLAGARRLHDGVALYYSHASIQVSWCLDIEPHGKTWPNRLKDPLRGTSHLVRKAWETILNDAGLQYDFVAYDDVIKRGVPPRYKVLVLPACFALSDVEARRMRQFAQRGGIVVADFMCGLFDQHGRGRAKGVLDDFFGVEHDGSETKADFFSGKLWVETDQDKGYGARRWRDLVMTLGGKMRDGFTVAERRLAGPYVKPNAVYLNLSPLRYLLLREEKRAEPRHREAFLDPMLLQPAVVATGDDHLELVRWEKEGRELLFVVQNPVLRADGSRALLRGKTDIDLTFAGDVTDVIDERTGKKLGEGTRFRVPFNRAEAVFLSYKRR